MVFPLNDAWDFESQTFNFPVPLWEQHSRAAVNKHFAITFNVKGQDFVFLLGMSSRRDYLTEVNQGPWVPHNQESFWCDIADPSHKASIEQIWTDCRSPQDNIRNMGFKLGEPLPVDLDGQSCAEDNRGGWSLGSSF